MHAPSTLVAALALAFASGAAAASATASGKTLNVDGIWPKTNSAQLEFVYAFPSATAEAQVCSHPDPPLHLTLAPPLQTSRIH